MIHRESLHSSPGDPRSHFTVVFYDKDGKDVRTGHLVNTDEEDKEGKKEDA